MASVQLNNGTGGALVAANAVTRDTVTEVMELINIADPTTATTAPVDSNGLHVSIQGSLPSGANNIGGVSVSNFPAATGPAQNSNGTGQFVPATDTTIPINVAANTTVTLVAGVSGKRVYVTSFVIMASLPASGAGTVQFVNQAAAAISGAMAVTPETGVAVGSGYGAVLVTASGDSLAVTTASGASVQGFLSYTQV